MEFNDMRAFVRVVDAGSVSAAARDLHITQSAVTKRLQRLESFLGATLFDRAQRPVVLTTAGQGALEKCRRLLNDMNDLRAAVSNGHAALADVRVGVAHALGEFVLTEPIGAVREEFPRHGLRLTTGWSPDLVENVRTGALDAAIVLLPESDRLPSEVLGTIVGKERLVILGPRKMQDTRVRQIKDLEGVQWILNPDGCGGRAILRRALGRADVNLVVGVESHNYELQLLLTSQGRGLTLAPERIFRASRLRSRLQMLRVAGLHFPFTIWSVQRSSAEPEPLFRRLNLLLTAALARHP
ncbi:MAG TPA: LysR family transcriptional regulator [Steroidobacteraceae bacterium]|nr:LysR family transcriptional regulator [Steroidobacteraceae bacterium]